MKALKSCRDVLEYRLPLGVPAVCGIAAAFATEVFADRAETVQRAVQMLASSREAEAFGLVRVRPAGVRC